MLCKDVATVVGIGYRVLRLAAIVTCMVAEGEGVEYGKGTTTERNLQTSTMSVLEERHLVGLVCIALVAKLLYNAHHGAIVDERLIDFIVLAIGGKLQALCTTMVGVVEA